MRMRNLALMICSRVIRLSKMQTMKSQWSILTITIRLTRFKLILLVHLKNPLLKRFQLVRCKWSRDNKIRSYFWINPSKISSMKTLRWHKLKMLDQIRIQIISCQMWTALNQRERENGTMISRMKFISRLIDLNHPLFYTTAITYLIQFFIVQGVLGFGVLGFFLRIS